MLPTKRPFLADEELGKKDDDHRRPLKQPDQQWQPKAWKLPRRRRILIVAIILYLLYIFFKNMPTDIPPARDRWKSKIPPSQHVMPDAPLPPAITQPDPPPREEPRVEGNDDLYYNGELKFYNLGRTLKLFEVPAGRRVKTPSKATVFAAASLKSVSDLLPLACRMASQKINEVHFVLMGRDDASPEGIQRVNGLDKGTCPIYWHDARVDYARWSTDARMQQAVGAVLPYIHKYVRPQILITHGEGFEEEFFMKGLRNVAGLGIPHISLPRPSRELLWMATIDSKALRIWNDIHLEILIQAPPDSAGSVINIIKSLEHADFLGLNPSLTIELPSRVDPVLLRFLKEMQWPPKTSGKITIRRRISSRPTSPKESSLHAVEAFYPKDPDLSHVLLLSPYTEVAPSFYHYLMYILLKYRYSERSTVLPSKLMGISLELPSLRLTSTGTFKFPDVEYSQFSNRNNPDSLPMFLWQTPNSNAALYFGDKWIELHSFLGRRFTSKESESRASDDEKVVSKRHPAFMEYLLELLRAKGYYILYPAFADKEGFSLTTFHNELFQMPEEFTEHSSEALKEPTSPERQLSEASNLMPLLDTFAMEPPALSLLPIVSYRGEETSALLFDQATEEYRREFKSRYGGCPEGSVDDDIDSEELFCAV